MININKSYLCGLIVLTLFGCKSESDSSQEPVSVMVPYNKLELPKPNDGYGYDNDFTITGIGENEALSLGTYNSYYQDYNNSYAALDGWGLCAEPILIPLQSIDSNKRYPLNENTLSGNVALLDSDGDEVPTQLSSDGSNLIIQCEEGLKAGEEYFVVVTDGVKTEFGEPLRADQTFIDLLDDPVTYSNSSTDLATQVSRAISLYQGDGNPVYAAQFKTQSAYSPLEAMRENHKSENTKFIGSIVPFEDNERKYDLYTQQLKIPFYLPFTESAEMDCVIDEFDPKERCKPLYQWMTTDAGGFPTAEDPLSRVVESQLLTTDIYTPAKWKEDGYYPLPTVIFIHGVTADKSAAALMAKDYTEKGFAVVAIDMPYHGERIRQDQNGAEISAKKNKSYFINIDSPLALRSNLQQSVSDFLGLRYALNGQPWVDSNNVHLVGHSLGGIMSVMVSEFSQGDGDFEFNTVNFVVPGQGLTNLTLSSQTLGPEMSEGVKDSPDVQRAIAETVIPDICTSDATNETCIVSLRKFVDESSDNALTVNKLEDDIYEALVTGLKQGVQTAIDSSDPASFTSRQAENNQPTLLLAAVGDCGSTCEVGEYIPDSVVPNSAPDNIRTGTEPLIKALGLLPITGDTGPFVSTKQTRGVLRTTTGGHGTYLFPYEGPMDESGLPGLPDSEELTYVWDATDTQQVAVASMVKTRGLAIEIANEDHIETEVAENEE